LVCRRRQPPLRTASTAALTVALAEMVSVLSSAPGATYCPLLGAKAPVNRDVVKPHWGHPVDDPAPRMRMAYLRVTRESF
jgi:hypothetical protein